MKILILLTCLFVSIKAASVTIWSPGPNAWAYPSDISQINVGDVGWSGSVSDITSSGNGLVSSGALWSGDDTHYLCASNFGLTLPDITGTSGNGGHQDWRVRRDDQAGTGTLYIRSISPSCLGDTQLDNLSIPSSWTTRDWRFSHSDTYEGDCIQEEIDHTYWNSNNARICYRYFGGWNGDDAEVDRIRLRLSVIQEWIVESVASTGDPAIGINPTIMPGETITVTGTGFIGTASYSTLITEDDNIIFYKIKIGDSLVFDATRTSDTTITAVIPSVPNEGPSQSLPVEVSIDNGFTWTTNDIRITVIDCRSSLDCDDSLFCTQDTCDQNNNICVHSEQCVNQVCDEDGDVCFDCRSDSDCAILDDGLWCSGNETICDVGTGDCRTPIPPCDIDNEICNESSQSCTLKPASDDASDFLSDNATTLMIVGVAAGGLAAVVLGLSIAGRLSSSDGNDIEAKKKLTGAGGAAAVIGGKGKGSPRGKNSPVRKGSPEKSDRNGSPQKTEVKEKDDNQRAIKALSGLSQLSDASVVLSRIQTDHSTSTTTERSVTASAIEATMPDYVDGPSWDEPSILNPNAPPAPSVTRLKKSSPTRNRSPKKSTRKGSVHGPGGRARSRSTGDASKRGTRTRAGSMLAQQKKLTQQD